MNEQRMVQPDGRGEPAPLLVTVTGGLSGYPLVKVHGELDFSNRGRLEANIERVLRTDPGVVILDLRSLRFIDSSGLHVILRADRLARGSGARLVIVPGPEHVMRSFAWVGLDRRLTFAERPATDALEPDPARA